MRSSRRLPARPLVQRLELGLSQQRVSQIYESVKVPGHLAHREEAIRAPRQYRLPVAEAMLLGSHACSYDVRRRATSSAATTSRITPPAVYGIPV